LGSHNVIVLDTHIWVWWVHDAPDLPAAYRAEVERREAEGLGISAISCWEVAKLVQLGRLNLAFPLEVWFSRALAEPGIQLLPLTPHIAVESTRLEPPFHRNPADQIIVGTARVYGCPLVMVDERIRAYPHAQLLP
jgi:PIN domain nuclease of toxin-antitoxin system